jgi:hypothetical protein
VLSGMLLALLGWTLYAVARESRIRQLRRAIRNKLEQEDGRLGVVQVAPVRAHRLLSGTPCPLSSKAWKKAHIVVDEVRTPKRRSRLVTDLRTGRGAR